jgi:hypothetical protein
MTVTLSWSIGDAIAPDSPTEANWFGVVGQLRGGQPEAAAIQSVRNRVQK